MNKHKGFTLIELLVVLAIISAVALGMGLALRGGDETVAVGAGQRTVSSLATAARAQAIMNGTNARLIIHIDPSEPDRYLRTAGIVREQLDADGRPYGTRRWVPTSDGTQLPRGVYVVPDPDDRAHPDLFGDDWDGDELPYSKFGGTFRLQYPKTPSGQEYAVEGNGAEWSYIEYGAGGEVTAGGSGQIVVTVGDQTPGTPVLTNPGNVRGLIIFPIGSTHATEDALALGRRYEDL